MFLLLKACSKVQVMLVVTCELKDSDTYVFLELFLNSVSVVEGGVKLKISHSVLMSGSKARSTLGGCCLEC
ncbi:MAG: hypothetical protein COB60_08260 [Flavobacteriaceae bacterium]|nr:MAG: hypothetical protein COB60_08260 [Flavobacteriaceae bacterium]